MTTDPADWVSHGDVRAWAAESTKLSRSVLPVTMFVYGDSGAIAPGVKCTAGLEWMPLLSDKLGISWYSYAIGGSDAIGISYHLMNGAVGGSGLPTPVGGSRWDGTRKGFAILHTGINDASGRTDYQAGTQVATDAVHQNGMTGALRTCLALLSHASRVEIEIGTLAGTWSTVTDSRHSGGSFRYTNAPGSSASVANVNFPAVGPFAGKVWLNLLTFATDSFPACSNVTIQIDGVTAATLNAAQLSMRNQYNTSRANNLGWGNQVVLLSSTPGSHTISVTHNGASGEYLGIDTILIPSTTPPPVFVPKEWNPNIGATLLSNKAILDPLYAAVVAEFPNAFYMPYQSININTDIGNDNLHPNDRGMRHMAQDWYAAVTDTFVTTDLDGLYLSLSAASSPFLSVLTGAWGLPSGQNFVAPKNVVFYISGGTVTAISVDGANTGLTSGTFVVPGGHSIAVTYSVVPSVTWYAV